MEYWRPSRSRRRPSRYSSGARIGTKSVRAVRLIVSPDNRLTIVERKEQEANALRLKAWRRRFFQTVRWEDYETIVMLRELRVGKEDR